ncbi:MAG: ATP-dependent zinc metalloprotease FtsH [Lentisphaeria bacterium]|nr:ATP-dependent zinc metalloprotease FtsH [Lentisphaeria bacterium]
MSDKKVNEPQPMKAGFPKKQLLFWVVLLLVIPFAVMHYQRESKLEVEELSSSQFEAYLQEGRITELQIEAQAGSAVQELRGQYSGVDDPALQQPFKAKVLYTDQLDALIREHCPRRDVRQANNFLPGLLYSLLPILVLVLLLSFVYSRAMRSAGRGALQFGKSRAKMLNPSMEKVTFNDVVGIEEAKEDVQEIVEYLKKPAHFKRLGGKIPRGVLMVGPPGTGKTLLAKAIAGEAEVPFFSISGSDFVEMFVGVGASRVRDMFEEGKKCAPCLIFIDEIDSVGRSRFSGIGGGHDEREQTLNALLVEMDGFEANSGVIVLAATNRPDVLDPALLRPGRFDRQIAIDLPDLQGRLAILNVHAKKIAIDPEADMRIVARGTPGFSGADLANLINEAALLATRRNLDKVGLPELEESRDKVRWGKERRSRRIDEKDRRLTAYHEAGHALVGMFCENATPLHKITIIPRGAAYLGATMHLPEQDQVHLSRKELLDHIAVCIGGRLAEEMIFDDVTTGASMDIMQATDIARKMVCQWGMSQKMGFINYAGAREHIFLGRDLTRSEDYGQETAREIDLEVRLIIDAAYERVRDILHTNLDKLKLLADTLLEKETMNAEEVYALLEMEMPPSKHDSLKDEAEEKPEKKKKTRRTKKSVAAKSSDAPDSSDSPAASDASDSSDSPASEDASE